MKVKLHLHPSQFREKPDSDKIKRLNYSILDEITEIELEELAERVGNHGQTFLPAIMNGKRGKNNFIEQQIFALDFDGGFTLEEFWERAEQFDVKPVFIYETFSSTKELQKFRVVYVNDCVIDNGEVAELMVAMLMKIFPESDKACKDCSRIFFGGKKLVYINVHNEIDLFNVALSMQSYLRMVDAHNYTRIIKAFANKHDIAINNNSLGIHKQCISENEEIWINTNIIKVFNQKSSFFYVVEKSKEHRKSMRENKKECSDKIQGITEETIANVCELYRDFMLMEISHQEKFLLLTNIYRIKGGVEMFFEHITENIEKWKEAVIFIRNNNYNPQYCKNGGCPYYEKCCAVSIVDKLKSKIRKVKDFQYGSLREAEIKLAEYMEEAMFHNPYDILLLQAQTALGKTTAYCNMIQKYGNKMPFMVVVPTNKLQEEVACELEKRDVPVYLTPNLKESLRRMGLDDLRDEIIQLYESGYGYKVKSRIREYVVENKKRLTEWQLSEFENYLNFKEKLDGSTCVVTTHAMFLGLNESILQNYRIIVDEDILMTIFKNTSSISILELEQLLQSGKLSDRQQRLAVDLLNAEHGNIIHNSCTIDLRADELDNFYEDETLSIYASVSDFLQANTYHVDLENQKVDFFKARKMPYVKMVVVSATLNKALYEGYCPNRKIGYRCIPMAKHRGNIIQYTAYSLSRSNMQDLNFENVLRSAKRIAGKERIPYISFMKYAADDIYFGKTEGYNEYKGKDLIVMGTPHGVPFVYKLIGAYLGYDANNTLSNQYIEHNGYMFKFMTYSDENMRNLQLYFIESELEQAVGRARVLRFDCTVYLFSNLPIRQAVIHQEDYMNRSKEGNNDFEHDRELL